MADIDYGDIKIYPGNYDDFMIASTQARERLQTDNAKKRRKLPSCNSLCRVLVPTPRSRNRPPAAPVKLIKSN